MKGPSRHLTLTLALVGLAVVATAEERIVGQPCEGCEAVFQGMPGELGWEVLLAPWGEPGERMVLEGMVRTADGEPAAGIVVYAYHTDDRGLYPPSLELSGAARRHGRLRAWAKTDAEGRYRFLTIRPAGYPRTRIAQHVHLHVLEPGRCTYYIDDVKFDDDPRLTDRERRRQPGRGGPGVVVPTRGADGTWLVVRDIVLGEAVPGYGDCGG